MPAQRLTSTTHHLWRSLVQVAQWFRAFHARFIAYESASDARGSALLSEWLLPEQQAQLEACGYFDVVGCDTGRRYRITRRSGTNVYQIDTAGNLTLGLCFLPEGCLVLGDVMLAQKLALETNESAALAIANKFPAAVQRGASYR